MLLLSLLAFNEDNVLTSDTSEPNEWDQGHPASRSTYTTMLLLLSLLAFNDDNVLASDVPEPNGWGQDRHVSRSTYNTMLLLQQTYGPSGCYQVQTSRSTSRESGWSPQSTMFLLQTSGGRTFCCRSLRWRQFALMLQR